MKTQVVLQLPILIALSAACQIVHPPPSITVLLDSEFTLAAKQSAIIADTDLTITFDSVPGDDRWPRKAECAASGPAVISLFVQQGNEPAQELILQTFTEQNGRTPDRQFEGMEDSVAVGSYLIQMTGIVPYPKNRSVQIKQAEYQIILLVSLK